MLSILDFLLLFLRFFIIEPSPEACPRPRVWMEAPDPDSDSRRHVPFPIWACIKAEPSEIIGEVAKWDGTNSCAESSNNSIKYDLEFWGNKI